MRMKLLILLATSLLFYTQTTAEKECPIKEYKLTDSEAAFSASQVACKDLEGKLASEDLKDSENADKAQAAIDAWRQASSDNQWKVIWLEVTIKNIDQPSDENNNYFVFSDGSKFDDTDFAYKWEKNDMGVDHPDYTNTEIRCSYIYQNNNMKSCSCGGFAGHGLCAIYQKCGSEDDNKDETGDETEDESSASSGSELSRANLSVFALFMACSVFKTFYALVGVFF